jgi:hypothetical protein
VTLIGARADPSFEYGRFFLGTIHELRCGKTPFGGSGFLVNTIICQDRLETRDKHR